ncbi:MAG TPA: molybdate ABC transporter substrate-binding protein [Candidatus Acidoferrum sp.]|nr:molybdate ABC transporter substrate-binding protein [Candidatus Acidoferrum sp.]
MKFAVLALACMIAGCAGSRERRLTIAAAADLNFALDEIVAHYPGQLRVSYGSSGNFATQIANGAPFDLFLSADIEYARRVAPNPGAVFPYAIGRLVVWVPASSPLDPATALRSPALRHLAIASPQHAPYGKAAEAALRHMGLWDAVQPKLVLGENIVQAFQLVDSGAAEAGMVALSLALGPAGRARGRYSEIPLDAYPRLEQGGVILKDSPAARAFRDYLIGPEGRRILERYGFSLPPN